MTHPPDRIQHAGGALGVFISYRRRDTRYPAAWLDERLVSHFGRSHVFKDVDSIKPGEDFVEAISRAVNECHTMLVVIGNDWLNKPSHLARASAVPSIDFVYLEIEQALSHGLRVIPVLIDGASMPSEAQLPPSIVALARRNAIELHANHFNADFDRLLPVIQQARQSAEHAASISPSIRRASLSGQLGDSSPPTQLPSPAEPTVINNVIPTGSRARRKARVPSPSSAETWTVRESTLLGHGGGVAAVAVSSVDNQSVVVSGGDDGTVRLWNIATGRPIGRPLDGHTAPVVSIVTTTLADRAIAVSASWDSSLRVWDLASGESVGKPLIGHRGEVNAVATACIDGRTVAVSAGADKRIRVWNLDPSARSSEAIGSRWNRSVDCIRALATASINGREVTVTVAADGTVQVWDLRDRKLVDGPYNLNRGLHAIAIGGSTRDRSPFAVTGGADPSITIWDVASSRIYQRDLVGHTKSIEALAIEQLSGSPIVASGSSDTTIGLWDLLTATHLKSLTGHTDWVQAVAMTHVAGELILVSGSADATIRIWNVARHLAERR